MSERKPQLDEKDLRCILWLIKSAIHTGGILAGCRYCKYSEECKEKYFSEDWTKFGYYTVMKKLEEIVSPLENYELLWADDALSSSRNYQM